MNISCRIANADTQCGRITNPPEREGTDLKMSLMEHTFGKAIEKKQEEQRRKEEENEKFI
jgi:hypothetical protein